MSFKLEFNEHKDDKLEVYGFMSYRTDGRSMPKGWITSYNAYTRIGESAIGSSWIEFSIQSPTGDSSDHHTFRFPCLNFEQATSIVLANYRNIEILMDEYELDIV